jgi:hypothetical protein
LFAGSRAWEAAGETLSYGTEADPGHRQIQTKF